MPRRAIVLAAAFAIAGAAPSPTETTTDDGADDATAEWVAGKLQTMSVREKVGQLLMVDVRGIALTAELATHLWDGAYGSVIFFERNVVDPDQVRLFVRQLQDHAVVRSGVPLLVAADQEGGSVSRLGTVLGLKSTSHSARTIGRVFRYAPARAERAIDAATEELARRMHDLGFNMNLAPVLDLTDDPSSYIYDRSYGADPDVVAALTGRYADIMRRHRVATTGKHFPNLSISRPDSHKEMPVLGRTAAELRAHELVPFRKLRDKLGAVMLGHIMVPAVDPKYPASVSVRHGDLLRRVVGFQGVAVSDDLKMRALADRYPLEEILVRGVRAGTDLFILAWGQAKQVEAVAALEKAVARGWITHERLDEAVRRVLTLKRAVRPER